MPITIIKKRNVTESRAPAPLVEPQKPEMQGKQIVVSCSFCGHGYITPCHGKSDKCMNRRFVEQHGKKAKVA